MELKIKEYIERNKDKIGIVSFEREITSVHLKVKRGYEQRGANFICELARKFKGIVMSGTTQVFVEDKRRIQKQ